jgi:DNA polymerase delta subunit 1
MMAHNICYTTLAKKANLVQYGLKKDEDYIESDEGHCFVKPHIRKGILPMILEDLISTRKKAKAELALATD